MFQFNLTLDNKIKRYRFKTTKLASFIAQYPLTFVNLECGMTDIQLHSPSTPTLKIDLPTLQPPT